MNTPDEPELETFPLAYVVEKTGVPSERWIRTRLNSGELRGRRAGREWRMTRSDIADLVEYMANKPNPQRVPAPVKTAPAHANPTGLSPASRRRLERRTH